MSPRGQPGPAHLHAVVHVNGQVMSQNPAGGFGTAITRLAATILEQMKLNADAPLMTRGREEGLDVHVILRHPEVNSRPAVAVKRRDTLRSKR